MPTPMSSVDPKSTAAEAAVPRAAPNTATMTRPSSTVRRSPVRNGLVGLAVAGVAAPLAWPALGFAAFTVWMQAAVWWPVGWPLARLVAPGLLGTEAIKWNFTKFLVDGQGNVLSRYGSRTTPRSS